MPTAVGFLSASALNGKLYAIGGGPKPIVTNEVVEYDPEMDRWRKLADMPTGRWILSASVLGGKIYAIGGSDNVQCISTVEEYTPEGWQPKAVFPQGKLPTKWGEMK